MFDSVPIENIIFASEMIGAVRIKDPKTDTYFDDTKLYVDKLDLSDADRKLSVRGQCPTGVSAAESTAGESNVVCSDSKRVPWWRLRAAIGCLATPGLEN